MSTLPPSSVEQIIAQAAWVLYQVEIPPCTLRPLASKARQAWPDRLRFNAILDDFEKSYFLTPTTP